MLFVMCIFVSFKNKIHYTVFSVGFWFFYKCCWLMLKQSSKWCCSIHFLVHLSPLSTGSEHNEKLQYPGWREQHFSLWESLEMCPLLHLSTPKRYPKSFSFLLFQGYICLWNLPGFFWGLNDLQHHISSCCMYGHMHLNIFPLHFCD